MPHFHSFDCVHRHDLHSKLCLEALVQLHKTSQSNRDIQSSDFKNATESIFTVNTSFDLRAHLVCRNFDGTAHIRFFRAQKSFLIGHLAKVCLDFADGGDISTNDDSKLSKKVFAHRPDSDTHGRL